MNQTEEADCTQMLSFSRTAWVDRTELQTSSVRLLKRSDLTITVRALQV